MSLDGMFLALKPLDRKGRARITTCGKSRINDSSIRIIDRRNITGKMAVLTSHISDNQARCQNWCIN